MTQKDSNVDRPSLTPTVYVVDDEPSVGDLLRRAIARMGYVPAVFLTAKDFLAAFDPARPGCLILDVHLPDMSGLQLLDVLNERRAPVPVVFMSGRAQFAMAVHAFKAGSLDFLEKPFTIQAMEAAIQRAIDTDHKNRELAGKKTDALRKIDSLTPRERQVMELVVSGRSNKRIADELGLSQKTIEVHRANVMTKMEAPSLADLVRMVVKDAGFDIQQSEAPAD